ncbi:MAG: diaminopimelate epimerase [Candidatus Omnitrophota bacterium]
MKMTDPVDLRFDLALEIFDRKIRVHYLNSGVPHAVIFVQGLDNIDVERIGRAVRFHKEFMPQGTNVDFIEVKDSNSIAVRTYERGVEGETFACGTGIAACAVVAMLKVKLGGSRERKGVNVKTKSGDTLKVYCRVDGEGKLSNLWFEGKAYMLYKGEIPL